MAHFAADTTTGPAASSGWDEPTNLTNDVSGTWGDNTAQQDASLVERLEAAAIGDSTSDDRDKAQEAKEHGWSAPIPLDYESLMLSNKELRAEGELPSWMANAGTYEWKDEYGEVGPEDEDLEKIIFDPALSANAGGYLKLIHQFNVHQEGEVQFDPIQDFKKAGLHPTILENLRKSNYAFPTPIQAFCIPAVLSKRDVMAVAQTGSGKTQAYLTPILSMLMGKARKLSKPKPLMESYDPKVDAMQAEPLVVVLCPTRELAIQIWYEARKMCYRSMLRPLVIYGGASRQNQTAELQRGCDILIGTPGRICDLVENSPQWLSLRRVKHTIIDEADEMVNQDWEKEMNTIMYGAASNMSEDHQFLMFSATFPAEARKLATHFLAPDHAQIHVGRPGSSHSNIHQVIVWVESNMKQQALWDLLMSLPACRTMIFCASLPTCDRVDDFLANNNVGCSVLASSRTQREREDAIGRFRKGTQPILISPIAFGRGLDVPNCMHVILYDMPRNIEEYVNCIGRTGRIGNQGQATSFFNERNLEIAPDLCKIMLECDHTLPDFLQEYAPADGVLNFEEEAPQDTAAVGDDAGGWGGAQPTVQSHDADGWGTGGPVAQSNDGWGSSAPAAGSAQASGNW